MTEHREKYIRLLLLYSYFYDARSREMDPSINLGHNGGWFKLALLGSLTRHPDTNTTLIGRNVFHAWEIVDLFSYPVFV